MPEPDVGCARGLRGRAPPRHRQARRARRAPRCRAADGHPRARAARPVPRDRRRRRRPEPARDRPPPRQGHVGAAARGPHPGGLRGARGGPVRARGPPAVPRAGLGAPRRRPPGSSTPRSAGRRASPRGWRSTSAARRHAPATRSCAPSRTRSRSPSWPARSRPAAPTRSGCTCGRSATRWWATSATTGPGSRCPMDRPFLHAEMLELDHPVTGEPLGLPTPRCPPTCSAVLDRLTEADAELGDGSGQSGLAAGHGGDVGQGEAVEVAADAGC